MEKDFFADIFDEQGDENFEILTEEEKDIEIEQKISGPVRGNIENLLINGRLTRNISFAGHEFVIKTLTVGEELAVAEVCASFAGSIAEARALATATVAASLESVDGLALMRSLGPDATASVRQKFNFIKNKWYWNIIGHIYQEYLGLVEEQMAAFEALQGK